MWQDGRMGTPLVQVQLLGPVRAADVEEAQTAIVSVIGELEASGDIMISRGNDALIA